MPDTCQGDSGGPLALDTQPGAGKAPKLAGITSFGFFCGVRPGVYTEVSEAGTTALLTSPPVVDPP